jgi:hypothetical protein
MLVPLLLASFAFWIWMIIDCATNEPPTGNDKLVWIVIIVFTQIVGALIYYFVRRRPRALRGVAGTNVGSAAPTINV